MNLSSKLSNNFLKLSPYLDKEKIEAFRILNPDEEFPFAIDKYKNKILVYFYEELAVDKKKEVFLGIQNYFQIPEDNLYSKDRKQQKSGTQYEKLDSSKENFIIKENGYSLYVNLKDYLDTGIFLDHRKSRKFVKEILAPKSKSVLNLFSYTSSFSIAANFGGSEFSTSVDMSNTYCEWSEKNFILNKMNLKKNKIIRENILELFEFMPTDKNFDLIILDPPTFSRSKKMKIPFDIQKDYIYLLNKSLEHLNESGKIFFSTNFQKFKLNQDNIKNSKIIEITNETIPDDFFNTNIHKSFLISKDSL